MLLCAIRSWRELAKRHRLRRRVDAVKVSRQQALLRFSCCMLAAQLRHLAMKPLAEGLQRCGKL